MMICSEQIKILVEPEFGGRITNLSRILGQEWLAPAHAPLVARAVGEVYIRPEMGGWDEMCPTTDQCIGFDGKELPDHGEVWSRSWEVIQKSNSSVTLSLDLTSRPLRLVRKINISANEVLLSYSIENIGNSSTPIFWSAHPLFDATEIVEVVLLPKDVINKELLAVNLLKGTSAEHWISPGLLINRVELYKSNKEKLSISWDNQEIPYFGIFIDNGEYCFDPVISPQPAIGHKVSEKNAYESGNIEILLPGQVKKFELKLELEKV